MTQHQSSAPEGSDEERDTTEGNPLGGSPTFPGTATARPTGDSTGFNGSYTETEHHTQHEYDAENQHGDESADTSGEQEQKD